MGRCRRPRYLSSSRQAVIYATWQAACTLRSCSGHSQRKEVVRMDNSPRHIRWLGAQSYLECCANSIQWHGTGKAAWFQQFHQVSPSDGRRRSRRILANHTERLRREYLSATSIWGATASCGCNSGVLLPTTSQENLEYYYLDTCSCCMGNRC